MTAQNVFAIFGSSKPEELDSLIESTFGDNARMINHGQWLVRSEFKNAFEVYEKLFKENDPIHCIILPA